jgi:hypothetical protein
MTKVDLGRPPTDLGPSGLALWTAITAEFDLESHEYVELREAARCCDSCDRLTAEAEKLGMTSTDKLGRLVASPLLSERRQQQALLLRCLAALRIPASEGASGQRRGPRGAYRARTLELVRSERDAA